MIEMLQGFFACIGAALFFASMVIAMRSFLCESVSARADGEDSGAPEGDQIHFRIVEDLNPHLDDPTRSAKAR